MKFLNTAATALAMASTASAAYAGPVNTAPPTVDRHAAKASQVTCAVAARAESDEVSTGERRGNDRKYILRKVHTLFGRYQEPSAPNRR